MSHLNSKNKIQNLSAMEIDMVTGGMEQFETFNATPHASTRCGFLNRICFFEFLAAASFVISVLGFIVNFVDLIYDIDSNKKTTQLLNEIANETKCECDIA